MYEPEADFEKDKYPELIKKIKSIKDEELSEEFDRKFFSELKVTPKTPLVIYIKNYWSKKYYYLRNLLANRNPKITFALSLTLIVFILALIFVVFQPFKVNNEPQMTDKKLSPTEDSTLVVKQKTEEELKDTSLIKPTELLVKQNVTKNKKYIDDLLKELNHSRTFGPGESSQNKLLEILNSEVFRKEMDSVNASKTISRTDTINLLMKLYRVKRKNL